MLSRRTFAARGLYGALGLVAAAAGAKAQPAGSILEVQAPPARRHAAGEGLQVPAGVPLSGRNGPAISKLAITCTVENDKPLASPA